LKKYRQRTEPCFLDKNKGCIKKSCLYFFKKFFWYNNL